MDSNHLHQESNSCVLPIELNGYIEECEINPTLFFWSFHVVRFCERRVKFKLASPLYSDHPYNVTGGKVKNRTLNCSATNCRVTFTPRSPRVLVFPRCHSRITHLSKCPTVDSRLLRPKSTQYIGIHFF